MSSFGGFGKLLASTEKSDRDRAVRAIASWLRNRSDVSETELAKLWKGIFYCFWLSDKPKVQQQLADRLAKMVLAVPPLMGIKLLRSFWLTMIREWHGIDRLRMDKFYFLCRRFLRYGFQMLIDHEWADTYVDSFADTLDATLMNVNDPKVPDGLRYHSAETFLEELRESLLASKAAENDGPRSVPAKLFVPFFRAWGSTSNKQLRDLLDSEILSKITSASTDGLGFTVDRQDLAVHVRQLGDEADEKGRRHLASYLGWSNKVLGVDGASATELPSETGKPAKTKKRKRTASAEDVPEKAAKDPQAAEENLGTGTVSTESVENVAGLLVEADVEDASGKPATKKEKRRVSWGPNATRTFRSKAPLASFGTAVEPLKNARSPKKPVLRKG
ncbi:nucleolar protein,Nop52-domain-containing protein [Hyaloraphidium curvatum]|nr:nucleolar protein,Nop52-domain-containing protein [Hyaloraphidium curvatum]